MRHTNTRDDACRANRTRPDADFDAVGACFDERFRRGARGDVAANDLHIGVLLFHALHTVEDTFRMSVRRVDDQHVGAGLDQGVDPIVRVTTCADGSAHAQRAGAVLAGEREVLGLLEILGRDHALQFEVVVDDQHLLDAVLVQQPQNFLIRRAFAHRDEPLLRRHDFGNRRVELRLETDVATRNDANRHAVVDDRHAGDAHGARQLEDLADRHVGRHRDRVAHHARLELLDHQDLPGLLLDGHVLVDDADAALLCQRDRESRFRHGVHGG